MHRLILAFVLAAATATSGTAQENPVVVELFTSQGCSSCPPADAIMKDLAAKEDIIALALHVDYWDYIGWKDEFADPRNAERQRAYARAGERRSIYTPEFIVGGTTDIVGAKPVSLMEAIVDHAAAPPAIDVLLERAGSRLVIEARSRVPMIRPLDVHLVRYQPSRKARITRGENAGRDFVYANVTEDWRVIGQWDAKAPLKIVTEIAGDLPIVVIVQEAKAGKILGAAVSK